MEGSARILKGVVLAASMSAALLLIPAGAAADSTPNQKFKELPSALGWTYTSDSCCVPPEASVFSVSDRILTQDTRGNTDSSHYELPGVPDPTEPYKLFMRAKVLDEVLQGPAPNHFGFGLSGMTTTEAFGIGIGTHAIQDILPNNVIDTTIDNTVFHDYLLKVEPGVGYEFFVDKDLISTGPPRTDGPFPHRVQFGDLTNGAGALAKVDRFQFLQD